MIEALIAYIEDQGFTVRVLPDRLCIRKTAKGRLWGIDWALSSYNLSMARTCKELLFLDADHRLAELRKSIKEGKESNE